jgi:hypothetical protein
VSGKPIICVDFDGVIHSYDRGWQDGSIYGTAVPGFFDWLNEAWKSFTIVIYSSRSKTPKGLEEMKTWLSDQEYKWLLNKNPDTGVYPEGTVSFTHEKPLAFLTIDDRALTFNGDWTVFAPNKLVTFKPWNVK